MPAAGAIPKGRSFAALAAGTALVIQGAWVVVAWTIAVAFFVAECVAAWVVWEIADSSTYASEMRERFSRPLSLASLCDVGVMIFFGYVSIRAVPWAFRAAGWVGRALTGATGE